MSDTKKFYEGTPWHADEDEDCVRIFRGVYQIMKMPKHGTPYAEYWPDPDQLEWILQVLNQAEADKSKES